MLPFCAEVKFSSLGSVFMVAVSLIIACVFLTCGGWYFADDDSVFENVEVAEIQEIKITVSQMTVGSLRSYNSDAEDNID